MNWQLEYIKTQKFRRDKISDFFCPNINSSEILSRPKLFPAKIFRKYNFSFFFAITQMEIYIEDQFLGGNMWEEKRIQYCWNDALTMYLINTN